MALIPLVTLTADDHAALDEALHTYALDWLSACSPTSLLARSGLTSSKFNWLPT